MNFCTIRRYVGGAVIACVAIVCGIGARAQTYPARPVTVIVPFAGGSASDVVTRIMLDRMGKTLGQSFIVDNRPGGGGNIGTAMAVRAAPDGYTLVMSTVGPRRRRR
jgi:tripartite-type tricarboxylate transporter receptor subunit TctC